MNFDFFLNTIQLMLAPSVMISACGLLLLGIGNKNSSINNRIRLLNEERRRLMLKIKDNKEFDYVETTRLQSIHKQLGDLLNRLKLVRNVIVSFISGIFLFIITSLIIGLEIFTGIKPFDFLKTVFFGLGMISVGLGMIFSLIETLRGFKIVELEVKADE